MKRFIFKHKEIFVPERTPNIVSGQEKDLMKTLKTKFEEIRMIENKLKQIEYQS